MWPDRLQLPMDPPCPSWPLARQPWPLARRPRQPAPTRASGSPVRLPADLLDGTERTIPQSFFQTMGLLTAGLLTKNLLTKNLLTTTLVATVVLAIGLISPAAAAASEPRPNVIVILIDDMGWGDLSCFGGPDGVSPHIDALAAAGLRFEQFYVNSPICSPSRVALATGQYPHRWQVTSYLADRQRNQDRGVAQWLDPSAPVQARSFQMAGYATGHFGKWHMGGQRDVGQAPLPAAYGFDESLTNFEGLGPRIIPMKDAYDGQPAQPHDLGSANLGQGPLHRHDRSQVTSEYVSAALRFIDRAQQQDQPFYLNLWPDDVHSPFFPPADLRAATDGSKRQLYYAVLQAMDQQLAPLFQRVSQTPALAQNTIIVLMSDNGPESGAGVAGHLRGEKTWLFEGGVRSPLIVWAPGLIESHLAGTVNRQSYFCALDLNRSLYTLCGVPHGEGVELDGEDLAATLIGARQDSRSQPIFWRRPPDRPGNARQDNPDLAVRLGDWKYLVNYDGSDPQLYDLATDESEQHNRVDQHGDVARRLHQQLVAWNATLQPDAGDPAWAGHAATATVPQDHFVNPINEGADPWVVENRHAGEGQARYLWCASEGNRGIAIYTSDRLTELGTKHVVWRAPDSGMVSREVWAPELHYQDDRWHVYFAASDGRNENHLTYVLQSQSSDPLGPYQLHGPLATGDGADGRSPNIWSIDMTVMDWQGKRYALWSGWDAPGTDQQFLYIAPMKSPTELAGPRVLICANDDYLWERVEPGMQHRGLHEAPQVFTAGDRPVVTYSCGASWLPTYKLGMLRLIGDDPLNPQHWEKSPEPIFQSDGEVFGVGHSCFVRSPDQTQWWHVFHAKQDRHPGWRRAIFVQPMSVDADGLPVLGKPLPRNTPLPRPSGEPRDGSLPHPLALWPADTADAANAANAANAADTRGDGGDGGATAPPSSPPVNVIGHQQFYQLSEPSLRLGRAPEAPINDYRSGEKAMVRGWTASDVRAQVTIDFLGNRESRDAGLLFRTSGAALGYDAQRGYFAAIIPGDQRVILGKTDGARWHELARARRTIAVRRPQQLEVRTRGSQILVFLNGQQVIGIRDESYREGGVGVRVVDSEAIFSNLHVVENPPAER